MKKETRSFQLGIKSMGEMQMGDAIEGTPSIFRVWPKTASLKRGCDRPDTTCGTNHGRSRKRTFQAEGTARRETLGL
jgi:hypothetical protein